MLLNTRNKRIYSDKNKLSVLDLNRVDLATEEDKANELVFWAKLFKSKTWEELRMLAKKEPIFKTIATEVRNISCFIVGINNIINSCTIVYTSGIMTNDEVCYQCIY